MAAQAFGIERGNAPVLSGLVEDVRRRADIHFGEQLFLPRPGLAAAAIGAHRQVGDQADGHPGLARLALGMLQATLGQPLAEGTEVHFLGVIGAERGHRRLAGAAQRLRPASPVGAGAQVRLQGLEAAVVQQGLAGFAAEFGEVVAQGLARSVKSRWSWRSRRMRRSAAAVQSISSRLSRRAISAARPARRIACSTAAAPRMVAGAACRTLKNSRLDGE